MDNLSLMTLLLAIATFILALAAVGTIWQNHRYRIEDRKLDFRRRSSDKISVWAQDTLQVLTCSDPGEIRPEQYQEAVDKIISYFRPIMARSLDVVNIAGKLDRELSQEINLTVSALMEFTYSLEKVQTEEDAAKCESLFKSLLEYLNEIGKTMAKLGESS